jgi:hypothetical protein
VEAIKARSRGGVEGDDGRGVAARRGVEASCFCVGQPAGGNGGVVQRVQVPAVVLQCRLKLPTARQQSAQS